ncbi:hypothetical protein [Proteiniphilum acetatigenes]|uniref:hypothetical protein n=1 Tax=Proteiniphilum acetatigenes TaxID=294710 RepID=UPI00037FFA16|nr:hypothetical protein [Proteiniphilum acetatigenes]
MIIFTLEWKPIKTIYMGKNLFKTVAVSLFSVAVLLGGYSCSDDYPDDYLTEAQIRRMIEEALRQNNQELEPKFTKWEILPYTVLKEHWDWNPDAGRYQAIYDLPELTDFIYEEGAVLGYVFIGQQGVNEVQKLLPYVHTYNDADTPYTETISFDIQYKSEGVVQPTVAFFIQTSDLFGGDEYVEYLPDYNFRIVLVW